MAFDPAVDIDAGISFDLLESSGIGYVVDGAVFSGSDITPTVGPFTPTSGSTLTPSQSITFPVTSTTGLSAVAVIAKFPALGIEEVIYNGNTFGLGYQGGANTKVPITNGFQFTCKRDTGWPASPVDMEVIAVSGGAVNGDS